MGRARGANALMRMAFETAYGSPPVGGFIPLPFVSSQLGAEQGLIESDLLGQGRSPSDPTYDVVTDDGDVVVPLDTTVIGQWLRLLLGVPSTTAGTPNTHVFRSGAQDLLSASIEIGHPDRPAYSTHYGVRANTFAVQMQRSGLTSATIGLIAKGETVTALTSSAGDVGAVGLFPRFAAATGSISVDGAVVGDVTQLNFNYSNGLEKIETIRADGEIGDTDPGMPAATIGLTARFSDLTLLAKATSKAPAAITFGWTAGTSSLSISLPRVFLPRSKRPISGPGGIQVSLNAIASSPPGGSLATFTLRNDAPNY